MPVFSHSVSACLQYQNACSILNAFGQLDYRTINNEATGIFEIVVFRKRKREKKTYSHLSVAYAGHNYIQRRPARPEKFLVFTVLTRVERSRQDESVLKFENLRRQICEFLQAIHIISSSVYLSGMRSVTHWFSSKLRSSAMNICVIVPVF